MMTGVVVDCRPFVLVQRLKRSRISNVLPSCGSVIILLCIAAQSSSSAFINLFLPGRPSFSVDSSCRTNALSRLAVSLDEQQQQHIRTAAAECADSSRNRFHQDMQRVLESRVPILNQLLLEHDTTNRRHKPLLLTSDIDGAERSLSMLQHLIRIGAANETSFQIVMRAFLRRHRMRWKKLQQHDDDDDDETIICAADQLEELLHDLQKVVAKDDDDDGTTISMQTVNLVLEAYAVCSTPRGGRNYAQRAQDLWMLHQKENCCNTETNAKSHFFLLDAKLHVLHAWAWQQENLQPGDCASQAQKLLDELYATAADELPPSSSLLLANDWVLESWSKSGSPGSAEKAQACLTRMIHLNQTLAALYDDDGVDDNDNLASSPCSILGTESYSNAILAWSKAVSVEDAPRRAHDLLMDLMGLYKAGAFVRSASSEPPLIAFNAVITAWGRVKNAERAHYVLKLLEGAANEHLQPDAVSYNTVLHAYLKCRDQKNARVQMSQLVRFMTESCQKQERRSSGICPNTFTYYTMLKFWIQQPIHDESCQDAAQQADLALNQMERLWKHGDFQVPPNNRIYNMVIHAYAKRSSIKKNGQQQHVAARVLQLLETMKASPYDDVRPDQVTYTSVLDCLSKSLDAEAPKKAQALLHEATELYNRTGNPAHMPNARMFTMVIQTFAKNQGNVQDARDLLTQLVGLYEKSNNDPQLRPTEFAYNYVLNCAANALPITSNEQQDAFSVATATFQEMRKSDLVRPDSFTYAFWLKCCNNLLPMNSNLRHKCIEYAVQECKRDGLVSQEVLIRLCQGSPPPVVYKLLERDKRQEQGTRKLRLEDLPRLWSRKAQTKRR